MSRKCFVWETLLLCNVLLQVLTKTCGWRGLIAVCWS